MAAIRKLMSAEQMEGAHVIGPHGENLGRIKDILVEVTSSQIVYAIVSYGGIAGIIGNRLFAVPWDVLTYHAGHDAYVLDIPEEKLKDAPVFDRANLQDIADPRWAEPVHKYYGSNASWYAGMPANAPVEIYPHKPTGDAAQHAGGS